jgi:signal transduction histidine kinase
MAFTRLTRRYIFALTAVALLSIGGQVVVQLALSKQQVDSAFINIAGRQRMLSQRVTWLSLRVYSELDTEVRQRLSIKLESALALWEASHRALREGDAGIGTIAEAGPLVDGLLAEVEPELNTMVEAARSLLAFDGVAPKRAGFSVENLLDAEARFLHQMDYIVFQFAAEAEGRVSTLRSIEALLLSLVLGTLAVEGLFVFRPAAAKVDEIMGKLETSEAQKSAVLAAMPDILVRIDADGHCVERLAVPEGAEDAAERICPRMAAPLSGGLGAALLGSLSQAGEHGLDLCLGPVDDQLAVELRAVPLGDEALVLVRDVTMLRRLERRLLSMAEETQRAVGRELHDGLCQELAGLHFMTRIAADEAGQGRAASAETLEQIADLVEHALEMGRRLSRGLFPLHLDESGLVHALEALCSRASAAHGVPVHCGAAAVEVERDTALQLLRITQEAVSNALRHGKPNEVHVSLDEGAEGIELLIEDDGIGLPTLPENAGLGLRSMEHRAHLMGARFSVGAKAGGGTRVWCMLPA